MNHTKNIFNSIKELWEYIGKRKKIQFGLLVVLMILSALAEILSIGAVVPFLNALTSPKYFFELSSAKPLLQILNITKSEELLLSLTLLFGVAVLFATILRLTLLWASGKLCFSVGASLSFDIYRRTLYQPYHVHIVRSSNEIINGISNKTNIVIYNIILPVVTLISSVLMLAIIMLVLIYINPLIALISFGGLGFLYFLIIKYTRKRLFIASHIIAKNSSIIIKSLQEGLGGIRDVLIDGTQEFYSSVYKRADSSLRRAQANSFFIGQGPRFLTEGLGMLIISGLAYAFTKQSHQSINFVATLGAIALGAQRLIPILQQAYSSLSYIQTGYLSLVDILELLNQPLPSYILNSKLKKMQFKENISLNSIWFRYDKESAWIIENLNLKIKKGSCIGIIGSTGCGKSTFLDIIMGLLNPSKGELQIDGIPITSSNYRAWQAHIAHVPQTVFLSDGCISENIAFGVDEEKINHELVKSCASQAQLAEMIDALPKKYNTPVGERGIRLSGGQRQRIGIARALYKQADVLIFDEATSALDNKTEDYIMNSIDKISKNFTILIIAHRLSTLKNCDQIIRMSEGKIKEVGTYARIIGQKYE